MPKAEKKRLVLLDAHAIIHRAYHALPDFSSSRGEPTGALYGLSSMLIRIISDLKPDYLAAAFDLPKPTYRHEAYAEYKAGRMKADDALVAQLQRSRDVFAAFSIPIYDKEGFEADDIIGTIVEKLKTKDYRLTTEIIIASGDMDTLQLVEGTRVRVFTLRKGITDTVMYDEEAVKSRFGFGPKLLPDFKGLKGDPSDNIKGIGGIGDKTATTLIQTFGTIEEMYRALKKNRAAFVKAGISERITTLLEAGKEDAEFSKMLGTIRRDAPIEFSLPEKPWRESVDLAKADALFAELEFRALPERLRFALLGNTKGETRRKKHEGGHTKKEETRRGTHEGKDTANKKGPSFGAAPKDGPSSRSVPHQPSFNDALQEAAIPAQELAETAVALWLVNSNLTNPKLGDILGFAKTRDFKKAREIIFAELQKRSGGRVFEEIERPLIPVITGMNEQGVRIDAKYLRDLGKEYHRSLAAFQKEVWKLVGEEFNLNSPKQLGDVLFGKLHLAAKHQKKTPGGALSTRESELMKLRDEHPAISKILECRELQKLLSTYIDPIPALLDADGRLHANFLQAGSRTGRMASENPNLQNIPNQTDLGRRIRHAFVAAPGFSLLALDYSQIELRIAAFLSGDEKLIEIFKRGEDVHAAVAAEVFGVRQDEVTKDMRRRAKVINFGILYGMGVNALRQSLGGTREEAQRFYDAYFTRFRGLSEYLAQVKAAAARQGYTETFFGRRRSFEAINSKITYIRAAAERMAVNAPIQGTCADIVKLAMVRIDECIVREKLQEDAALILQVHDELVYEVRDTRVRELAPRIRVTMESVLPPLRTRSVPLVAEVSVGKNWGEMEKL